jgi:hypothetical protein
MDKDNNNTELNDTDKKLHISVVIQRLSDLERVQIYGFGGYDEDYPNSPNIEKDIKQTKGRYVRYKDIKRLIEELKNVV